MRAMMAEGLSVAIALLLPVWACAWDYDGHRLVNQLALAAMPTNSPAFMQTSMNRERIAFLGGEPDRWRNSNDHPFRHAHGPDHYFDVEDLEPARLDARALSPFRYEFAAQLAVARERRPDAFPAIDPVQDLDHVRAWIGFLPWAIAEQAAQLKSAFAYLRAFEEMGGTEAEISNARQNVIDIMGLLGHFVGDATQPLHTTRHFNGWVGENPRGYSTNKTFHAWIDGGFLARLGLKANDLQSRVKPAKVLFGPGAAPSNTTNFFSATLGWLLIQHQQVIPLYQLEKDGKLSPQSPSPEGREFMARQLAEAAQMLADLWFTAWTQAPVDVFLSGQLHQRRANAPPAGPPQIRATPSPNPK